MKWRCILDTGDVRQWVGV